MNVTETSQRLMDGMTAQQIEDALRNAKVPRKARESHKARVRGKGKKKDLAENAAPVKKSKRPLNSYMAFRSYYSTIFPKVQQKEISGFVTWMWQVDPFKAKWTIVAKAYSAIRDVQGKANTPLDQFLAMSTPLMGIIQPRQYLEALGWYFVLEDDGQVAIQRENKKFDATSLSSNVSVNGVIENCHMQGFFTGRLSDVLLINDETTMTIVQSSPQATAENSGEEDTNIEASQADASTPEDQQTHDENTEIQAMEPTEINVPTPTATAGEPLEVPSSMTSESPQQVTPTTPTESLLPADFRLPEGEFALDEAFDPMLHKEQTVFDPFSGNQFDAFDWMDGWDKYINFDACS